jgi:hypothetical protein
MREEAREMYKIAETAYAEILKKREEKAKLKEDPNYVSKQPISRASRGSKSPSEINQSTDEESSLLGFTDTEKKLLVAVFRNK